MKKLLFIDIEVSIKTEKISDIGAIKESGEIFHKNDRHSFYDFSKDCNVVCGHNIVKHDLKYLSEFSNKSDYSYIDTLLLSPLIYPKKEYHHLLKDDLLFPESLNNPVNDCKKCRNLLYYEFNAFEKFSDTKKNIFGTLLNSIKGFDGFFEYVNWERCDYVERDILNEYKGFICENVNLKEIIEQFPVELSYALALISCNLKNELISPWVYNNYPQIEYVFKLLRGTPCESGCIYCNEHFSLKKRLKNYFGFENFRLFNGEPLQEKAATAAVKGKSLLAVFPTGGGKSITFQIPALVMGETSKGLTVVISPLQSLMKDQVDGLNKKGIVGAVTINGLLDPIERKKAIDLVLDGTASLLYISPELLRSYTIEKMLLKRNIERIVIDEAHCFSSWGQDFRVDYLYIGDFIKKIQEAKGLNYKIPVSCFTATAKQKVISDICDYFREKLNINLEIFATKAARENLHYRVQLIEKEEDKYMAIRELIKEKNCPTIIYCSRTKTTETLAEKLSMDGFNALAFNGKMEKSVKTENQDKFINDEVKIMVATSAFGMGVDKSDVKLVIHYDISDSLENYVQEAGRAGRNQELQADCVIFFNESDLDKHFMLLNQTKLNIADIRNVWKGIKSLTLKRNSVCCSALEIARAAGWDDSISDIETKVRTAISALESSGYIKRGLNSPRVFATSINSNIKTYQDAEKIIDRLKIKDEDKVIAKRIMKSLISSKYRALANTQDAESRVDYLADNLGIDKVEVISVIDKLRLCKILDDSNDMTAFIKIEEYNRITNEFKVYAEIERFLLEQLNENKELYDLKQLNDLALKNNIKNINVKRIRTILYFWSLEKYIDKPKHTLDNNYEIKLGNSGNKEILLEKIEKRIEISDFILEYLCNKSRYEKSDNINFSMAELVESFRAQISYVHKCNLQDVQTALLYLTKTFILKIEGGFLVLYNAMNIERLITDNKIQYKKDDYKTLEEYYKLKIEQIHIVGEYANMMVKDYNQALEFVNDYFFLEYDGFIKKYFKGDRKGQIKRNITPGRYNKLFKDLSPIQKKIIDDDSTQYISVLAGPGSGKTRVLVHKLASLLTLEDVKSEQLLMLTFSRAAATEFKTRLIGLIGTAAHYVDIKTFHSYCFDLLGKLGDEKEFEEIVPTAIQAIKDGEVEQGKINKTVLVVDEAQDMGEKESELIKTLIDKNPEMKVIFVGDDDQNIYEFRGSNSKNMVSIFKEQFNVKTYDLVDNYRSVKKIVDFTNQYLKSIPNRMKTSVIQSIRKENGYSAVINYSSQFIEEGVTNYVKNSYDSKKITAILTETNEEAYTIVGLLNKHGIKAKLMQANDGFKLLNLYEIRYFATIIHKSSNTPIVSVEDWNYAKNELNKKFKNSPVLELVNELISQFEIINKEKYKNDFYTFVRESKYEDFINLNKHRVVVSTIHKAKGKEFDVVHLMVKNKPLTDEKKRVMYVGMTRAKNELIVHTNVELFDFAIPSVAYINNSNQYLEPSNLMIELSHKDVNLNSFTYHGKKELVLSCLSGEKLLFDADSNLMLRKKDNCKMFYLSKAFSEKMKEYYEKGYVVQDVDIRFIVYWKNISDTDKDYNNKDKVYPIILPNIYLVKRN